MPTAAPPEYDIYMVTLLDADGSALSVPTRCFGTTTADRTEICAHEGIDAIRDGLFTGAAIYDPVRIKRSTVTALDPQFMYTDRRDCFRGHLFVGTWEEDE